MYTGSSGSGSTWGISSIFSTSDTRPVNGSNREHVPVRSFVEPAQGPLESSFSSIQLREVGSFTLYPSYCCLILVLVIYIMDLIITCRGWCFHCMFWNNDN